MSDDSTMTERIRPEDIPKDVWAEADRIWVTSDANPVELIARTLLAKSPIDRYTDATFETGVRALTQDLVTKSRELVDSVSHDNNGSIVGGQYMGGNGGLYSRETFKAADALRLELERWK